MVRAHEVDLIAAGTTNDFPNSEMGFSQPYEYFPEVIVARLDGPPIAGPKDLDSKKIAFRMESGLYSRLRARYGENMLYPTTSNEAGLAAVDTRTADAFIGTLPAIDALIRNRYVGNLHVIGPAGMDQEFSIGVRSEFAQLLPLIDHVLGNMDSGDKQAMRSRWIAAEYRYGAPWKWVLIGVVIAALVLASIVGAYARLRRTSKALQSAERAHAAQLRFQQELMETIPYPVFVKDKNGRYLAVNRAYEDTLHCSRQDLLGHTIEETQHLHGVSAKALMQADQDLMVSESGSTRRELKYIDAHDGGERSIIIWLRPFSDEPTGTKSLLGTAVDISEVRAAEARARASEQQLSDITQTMPSVVFRIIAYPDGRRRFTYAGGAVEELLDMPVQSLLDDEPLLLSRLHPDDKPVVTDNVEISRRTLQPMPAFDFRLRVSDGWRWLRTEGGHPRPIGNGSAEWTGYWIDTTTLHEQAEALHRAKAEAEAATAAKGAFLAAMSHEIRTPMADVLALIELLGRSHLNSDQTTMLAMIQESARSLMQVLDDILDHSRLEAGRMQIEHTRFDVRNLLDGIVGVFAARAAAKGIMLRSIMDWRLAAEFYGDPFRIRQILSNLMSNAVKFTEQGAIVLHVEIGRPTPSGQLLRFNVTDTGIGIKPDNLARLFQPFTQAEDSTARRFGGTGLGLSISRRLASMMDGEIRLQSTPGSGTHATFEVALEVAEHCVTQSQLAGKTVALACTDEARSDELSNALSALGFRVMQIDEEDFAEPITGVDLFVADTALPARLHPSATPCLFVDDRAPHRMPYRSSAGVVVPTGPLLYHSLELGCLEALGIPLPVVAPTKAAERVQHRAHVLVAEDHANNRVVMARQLEALGYPYSIVENGLEALDLWSRQHFDVLITDCHMPGLDGYDLARRIREHEGNQRRLVILGVSASAQPEQLEYCRQAGMDDFLSKPVRLDDLAVMLSRHLDVEHAAPSSGGLAMDGASKATPLPHLQQIFRDRNNLAVYLRDLLSNCRADLSELDFLIQTADVAAQRRLLHRIEGGLDTLRPTGSENLHRDDLSVSARRSDVVSAMEQLEQLVRGFFNDVSG
ncbi:ATP-binding protein [Stenotrophomonas terrae]|uniref:ATP-binding protein n=1 Tax=Stenotrophomonas terrae TaxID=405446 RepID=UPI003D366917